MMLVQIHAAVPHVPSPPYNWLHDNPFDVGFKRHEQSPLGCAKRPQEYGLIDEIQRRVPRYHQLMVLLGIGLYGIMERQVVRRVESMVVSRRSSRDESYPYAAHDRRHRGRWACRSQHTNTAVLGKATWREAPEWARAR
jgi:hypothetical protein